MNIQKEQPNDVSRIGKTIAVMSGKGGVGKSSVTALLALSLRNQGYRVGILDADVTGPSIPRLFGMNHDQASGTETGVNPITSRTGIQVMSVNVVLDNPEDPVVWRGPVISGTVKQFYTQVNWGDLDYLLIDMPPGTGDVPLTVMQSIELHGVVTVTSPQDLVSMIVGKSVRMANMLNIPMLGVVENMSWFKCDNCDKQHFIFGESKLAEIADDWNVPVIGRLPMDPMFASLCDEGRIERYPDQAGQDFTAFCETAMPILLKNESATA